IAVRESCEWKPPVTVSPDGKLIAVLKSTEQRSNRLRLFHALDGEQLHDLEFESDYPQGVLFPPDSRTVIVVGDKRIATWETRSGKALPGFGLGSDNTIQAVSFAADNNLLAIGSKPYAHVWAVVAGKWLHLLKGYGPEGYYLERSMAEGGRQTGFRSGRLDTRSIAFSRDSKLLAAAGEGGRVRLWSLPDGKERQPIASGHE